ncbi:MAG TPA: phenylalanine--tRNA ligase subunit beta [Chthoniobacterales bacterium]
MKISLRWLKEFLPFTGSVEALSEAMTASGMEIASIEHRGGPLDRVVVAAIDSFGRHPNADRLSVCQVNDGSGTLRQIVCGATNFKAGDKVPLALPGAVLPGGFKIKASKLRGVESDGMLCSAKELNLAEDSAGLLILEPDQTVGVPLSELFPADVIFDLELTPDRPDLLSYMGIARELAALLALTPNLPTPRATTDRASGPQLQTSEAQGCPYIVFQRLENVHVAPSPRWMRERLAASGLRPINNVVDITNYVMLESGKPIHAYDAASVRGGIDVRRARPGETLPALDGRTYELNDRHLVIADGAGVLGLAGVMGGEASGVREGTREVWLESAYFDPGWVREASRGLGLLSDASYRFERGVDPLSVDIAATRATQLIQELAGAEPVGPLLTAGRLPPLPGPIHLRAARCTRVLGREVPDYTEQLRRIGVNPIKEGWWQPPSYRPDLVREVDLIEEVCRLSGVDKIEGRVVAKATASSAADKAHDAGMGLRRRLAALGLAEARNLALIDEAALGEVLGEGAPNVWHLRNPLAGELRVLRPALVPGLIQAAGRNFQRGSSGVALFEIGRVFQRAETEETTSVGVVLAGERQPKRWNQAAFVYDFFDLKRVVQTIAGQEIEFDRCEPNAVAALLCRVRSQDGTVFGWAGQVRPSVARKYDVRGALFAAELPFRWFSRPFRYTPLDRFPPVTRDVAFLAPLSLKYGRVQEVLRELREPLLVQTELFDLFTDPTGARIPPNQKSIALSLTYRASDRTLTQDDVAVAHQRVKKELVTRLGVTLRE